MGIRHLILRQNPKPGELARWINQLNLVAESTRHALHVMVVSNSRNEHGEVVFGMNDAAGVFAACIREEWDSVGLKKGYMYMAEGVAVTIKHFPGGGARENGFDPHYALLFISPSSGEYFNATKGYLELDICENKQVVDVDGQGRPAGSFHTETTLQGAGKLKDIYENVHGRGGKVISNINFTLAWEAGNVEAYADALLAGFDTYTDAAADVIFGVYPPTGRMPITLPKNDEVIRVDKDGLCVSHNDGLGY